MDTSQTLPVSGVAQFEVNGQRSIMLLDPTLLAMEKPSKLSYYLGAVKSGSPHNRLEACKAIIFRFNDLEGTKVLYDKLNQVDHPSVLKSMGLAKGVGDYKNYTFLALTPFDSTLAPYIQRHTGCDHNGRLTEEFITLVSDIIDGLEELHDLGYCCPELQGDDVAVIRQSGLINAKIWKFKKCDPGMEEKQKDEDWIYLGRLIVSVSCSKEVTNLMRKIIKGTVKGKSIMKECALLTVRKKFENVLAFNLHITIRCPQNSNASQNKNVLKANEISAASLEAHLDRWLSWTTPAWTQARGLPISTKTLRGFVNQLRIFFEHEIFYIPELTMKEKLEYKKPEDLEHQLQGECCGMAFRVVQKLVNELKLEY